MPYALASRMTFFRRRAMMALAAALAVVAALATSTSAHQTLVRAHVARDGSVVISGYDGGAALAPSAKP